MSLYHGKDARIYLGGYDISAIAMSLGIDRELEMATYAVMDGSDGYHHVGGMGKDALSMEAVFDDNYMDVLNALYAASTEYGIIIPFGSTQMDAGVAAYGVRMSKYNMKSVISDVNKLMCEFLTNIYPFDEVKMLQPKTTVSAGGNGTAVDEDAQSSNGAVAYLQVFAVNGGDTLTVSINDSNDNFSGDDNQLLAFTGATDVTFERVTVSGTVERYIRPVWSGATGACIFAVAWKRL